MLTCIVCRSPNICIDDSVVGAGLGKCICLLCYEHVLGDGRLMSKRLRREVTEVAGRD